MAILEPLTLEDEALGGARPLLVKRLELPRRYLSVRNARVRTCGIPFGPQRLAGLAPERVVVLRDNRWQAKNGPAMRAGRVEKPADKVVFIPLAG